MDELELAERFWIRLESARESLPVSFSWYPYLSLSNVEHLRELFGEDLSTFLRGYATDGPFIDIGCGDGDLAFFLESLGFDIDAVDNPVFNHNGMRGVHALRHALSSGMTVAATDLDGALLQLPRASYSLALLLGVLYHLRNPFHVLDRLSRCCRRLVLSTRVAERFPGVPVSVRDVSAAYLLGRDELNGDDSNYWIFTPAALERILQRSHWQVERSLFKGAAASDPISLERDERAFLLLRSTFGAMEVQLLHGWHQPEHEGWRWTERTFSLAFHAQPGRTVVKLQLYVPECIVAGGVPVELTGHYNQTSLGSETYPAPGVYCHARAIPIADARRVELTFRLSHAIAPDTQDCRERGIIVTSCSVESA